MSNETPQLPDFSAFFAHALSEMDKEDPWDDARLHPSDLGSVLPGEGCLRRIYLRTHGAKGQPDTTGKRLMLQAGKSLHVLLQDMIGKHFDSWRGLMGGWVLRAVEGEAAPIEGMDGGHYDVLLEHIPSGTKLVLDFKTVSGKSFFYLQREKAAKAPHQLQACRYMMSEDATFGIVVYVDREGSGGFWVSPPFGRADDAVRTAWKRLEEGTRELPPPPPPASVMIDAPGGGKVAQAALPWFCQYHNALGEVEQCPYLDTEHCPGALPKAERPEISFAWTKRKIVKKGGAS